MDASISEPHLGPYLQNSDILGCSEDKVVFAIGAAATPPDSHI